MLKWHVYYFIAMEDKKAEIERLFNAAFPEDAEWNRWFFDRVYNDSEAMLLTDQDKPVSCLMSQKYDFKFHNQYLPLAYICGVATDRRLRGHGFMSSLLKNALHESYLRGDAFAGVIPADRRLYFFYDKFGFATVVYSGIERFASLHSFPIEKDLCFVTPTYQAFASLEKMREATVIHTERNFIDILYDINHDGGCVVQVEDDKNSPLAMAFATANETEIHVKELLGSYPPALDMALSEVKRKLGSDKTMIVYGVPKDSAPFALRARGMMRIINVLNVLSALAGQYPNLSQNIRVRDNLIKENEGLYILHGGECLFRHNDEGAKIKISMEVTTDVLTKILFSDKYIQNVFNIPTARPSMSLMLD